ncbi:MAG TPA: tyrosine-protein phosphatase [Candidatus Luteococcus avicola]|nr:tyrosine-protein phosphatase [Candidatus Luteococcus avicola]
MVNMRDLGGKPTADGRATVPGRVIRTDNLQDLPPESVRRLVDEFGVPIFHNQAASEDAWRETHVWLLEHHPDEIDRVPASRTL